jgi:hypothetical protein
MRKRYHPLPSPTPATLTTHKPLSDMTPEEGVAYLGQLMERLRRKQQRERAYLDRRAARGTHTPTDEVYEQDQVLENELLSLLEDLYHNGQEHLNP